MPDVDYIFAGKTIVPIPTPFYPVIEGEDYVNFNQGAVYLHSPKGLTIIDAEGCNDNWGRADAHFYLNIYTGDAGYINYARVKDLIDSISNDPSFSYYVPMCKFNIDGALENVYLRENIHIHKSLPTGELGDILYNDGTDWVILEAPAPPYVYVLASSGTAPYWLETEDCSGIA